MSQTPELVRRLARLVAFDTQNPGGVEAPMAAALAGELRDLGAAQVEILPVDNHRSVYARFGEGTPRILVNAHIDTVPANTGYSASPHELVVRGRRLHGLGAADTKGAIAALLDVLAARKAAGDPVRGLAVLLSGDEELGGLCTRAFLRSPLAAGLERALVCEPTACRVGKRHRGVGSAEATASSPGGHSSLADHLPAPIVALSRAAVALAELGKRYLTVGPPGFQGLCLNIASIDGGVAFNVIPSRATLRLCLRPAPGQDIDALFAEAETVARAAAVDPITWSVTSANPPFEARDPGAWRDHLGPVVNEAVDLAFWTEAALFAERGIDAVVFGPGHIEQAHAADEYVDLDQLEIARDVFARLCARP